MTLQPRRSRHAARHRRSHAVAAAAPTLTLSQVALRLIPTLWRRSSLLHDLPVLWLSWGAVARRSTVMTAACQSLITLACSPFLLRVVPSCLPHPRGSWVIAVFPSMSLVLPSLAAAIV